MKLLKLLLKSTIPVLGTVRLDEKYASVTDLHVAISRLHGKKNISPQLVDGRLYTDWGVMKSTGIQLDRFPSTPTPNRLIGRIEIPDFSKILPVVSAGDVTRPALQGVAMEISKGDLHFVGCDGHRLTVHTTPTTCVRDFSCILPKRAAETLCKAKYSTAVELHADESHVSFSDDNTIVTARLVEGNYPNWRRTMPSVSASSGIRVLKKDIIRMLGIESPYEYVDILIDGGRLTMRDPDDVSAGLRLNRKYIKQACFADSEWYIADKLLSPTTIKTGNYTTVIMPIRGLNK